LKELFLNWGMLVISVVFNVLGVFIIKMRLNELGPIKMESIRSTIGYFLVMLKSPLVILGVLLFFLAPFIFAIALSHMDIVVAYPAQIGLNFVFLLVLALFFLGEQLTVGKMIGILFVLSGVIILNKAAG